MKARILKCVISAALILVMICGYAVNVSAADMAYNIYSDPDLQGESKFDTYMIDFKSTQTPYYTYWALANFQLYISPQSQNMYRGISGGGGYAGLQDRGPRQGYGHSAIMSFWEWFYSKDGTRTSLRATRMYPEPWTGDNDFTGEGEGTNWITPYAWEDDQWYRMVIHTWTDRETGRTFMGQWFQDLTTGEWTLISYFNTMLVNSCLTGNMHFFMENYLGSTSGEERDAYFKNMYIKTLQEQEWLSVTSTSLHHCNNVADNKTGAHSFGATQEYFWAKSGGAVPEGETQQQHDAKWTKQKLTIKQPAQPTIVKPVIKDITLEKGEDGTWTTAWEMDNTTSPQLSYQVEIKDISGKGIKAVAGTRPEVTSLAFEGLETDAFMCIVTVTDIFGNKVILSETTEAYEEEKSKLPADDPDDEKPTVNPVEPKPQEPATNDQSTEEKNEGLSPVMLAVIIVGVIAALGVITIPIVLTLGKKKK